MTETSQDRGRQFEVEVAGLLDGEPVPGSGSGKKYKLDVNGKLMLVSCKHTDAESFRVNAALIQEMRDATSGMSGVGADVFKVLAVRFGERERVAVIDLDDFVALLKYAGQLLAPTKDEMRRSAGSKPRLLRD